jgi:acyl carrier protein
MSNAETVISKIVVDQLGCSPGLVSRDKLLKDDLGLDSLDITEICLAAEEHFGYLIDDEYIDSIRTVGDIVRFYEDRGF